MLPETDLPQKPISKPLVIVGILVLLLTSTTFIPASWFGITPVIYKNAPLNLTDITTPENIAKDTNKDGIISWQEVINQNVDFGTSTNTATIDEQAIAQLNDPNNLTASFSKNLYLAYTYLQKTGTWDETVKQNMLQQLIAQESAKIVPTTYSLREITIASTETKESIKKYGNAIAPLINATINEKYLANDFGSINSFTQTQKESDLVSILDDKKRVDSLLQKILAISVPPSAVPYHILLLERIALYRDSLTAIGNAPNDPIRATIAIENFGNAIPLIIKMVPQLSSYFNMKNIVFSAQDTGYVFTTGYTTTK